MEQPEELALGMYENRRVRVPELTEVLLLAARQVRRLPDDEVQPRHTLGAQDRELL